MLEFAILIFVVMVVFLMGAVYGWDLRERHATKTLQKFAHVVEKKISEEMKNMIHITIEQHNGMLFVYEKDKNTFMAQGKTREELEKALAERYPDKRFACDHETLVKIGFVS